ncbi:tetratricopeptide repeat protein [Paenibacillus marinisediminis]
MAGHKPHLTGPDIHPHNVVVFPVGAAAYAERAMRALERLQHDKALQYFRRAAEIEPGNPIHQCNHAGVLAETGQYEQSNHILEHVVTEMDPYMTECYYYMANNWAYLGEFDTAKVMLERYMSLDPKGMYAEEAEAMMDMIHYELKYETSRSLPRNPSSKGKGKRELAMEGIQETASSEEHEGSHAGDSYAQAESPHGRNEQEQDHLRARRLLEEGQFTEAVQILQRITEEDPDYLAAGNNLALAYYYMGRFEDAVITLNRVLERDSGNLHALCNLAVFERNAGHEDVVTELISLLAKLEPLHREHSYKLAATMGILGEHAEAYRHLKRIVANGSTSDPSVYHYAAVAACHMSRYDEAARWWAICRRLDMESGIAAYYLEQLQRPRPDGILEPQPSYHYRLPYDEASRRHQRQPQVEVLSRDEADEGPDNDWQSRMKRDPLVRSSLFWAIRFGDLPTRLQALEAMKMIGDEEAIEALRFLLTDPEQNPYVRQLSYYALRRLQQKGPLEYLGPNGMEMLEADYAVDHLPEWQMAWTRVIDSIRKQMDDRYELYIVHDAETLWLEYLSCCYPDTPKLIKADGWAAAVEYVTSKMHQRELTYHDVAARYQVSAATVSKNVKLIEAVCLIQDRLV